MQRMLGLSCYIPYTHTYVCTRNVRTRIRIYICSSKQEGTDAVLHARASLNAPALLATYIAYYAIYYIIYICLRERENSAYIYDNPSSIIPECHESSRTTRLRRLVSNNACLPACTRALRSLVIQSRHTSSTPCILLVAKVKSTCCQPCLSMKREAFQQCHGHAC